MLNLKIRKNYPSIILLFFAITLTSCGWNFVSTQPEVPLQIDSPATKTVTASKEIDTPISPHPVTEGSVTPQDQPNADVLQVRAVHAPDGTWTFHVTVSHPDTGWEDYADGWDILTPEGEVIKNNPDDPFTRLLAHPHVEEQPFTRSQSNITIPPDVTQVLVRAHDIINGYGGQVIVVDLTLDYGPGFEVEP